MTTAAISLRRPSPASKLLTTEAKLFLREPLALFWGVLFPLILIVVLGLASQHAKPDPELGGLRVVDVYVPITMAMVITILSLSALPTMLATYREKGILRRMSTTPVRPSVLLGADVAVMVTVILVALALIATVGNVAFNVNLPRQTPAFALTLVLGATALLSIGALVASIASTARIAAAIGTLVFFPMMFFAGLWIPQAEMPAALRHISEYTPLGAMVSAIQQTMRDQWPGASHLIVLGIYALVFSVAAARLFRWE
jgi:ABC-2 type transport system permease protein